MSDAIFSQRFYGHRAPAWHSKGRVSDKQETALEVWSQMTPYGLELRPLFADYSLKGDGSEFGELEEKWICRTPVPDDNCIHNFGIVGPDYQLLQPQDVCEVFDQVSNGLFVETMGSLGKGKQFFITTQLPDIRVGKNDKSATYLFIASPYTPGKAIKMIKTRVRVVCGNTWRMAELEGEYIWKGNHNSPELRDDFAVWLEHSIQQAKTGEDAVQQWMNMLAAYKPKQEKVFEVMYNIYPDPKPIPTNIPAKRRGKFEENFEKARKAAMQSRDVVEELFFGKADRPTAVEKDLRGTGWHLFQDVVEYVDYSFSTKDATESIILGDRASEKQHAANVISTFARTR